MRSIDLQSELNFERILLATDFSACAAVAQAYAVGLARKHGAALQLTTVAKLPALDAISECALDSFRHASEEELRRLAAPIVGVRITLKVVEGFKPATEIVEEAIRFRADLMVLGTSSKHGLTKLALGSTAEEVIRTAFCPVLTVGPHVKAPASGPVSFRRIVYATDFSAQAAKGAKLALGLGHAEGTKVYLCHVAAGGHAVAEGVGTKAVDGEASSLSSLKALVDRSAHCWVDPECVVEHGKAAEAILALAERVNADVIVLGARQESFWVEFIQTGLTPALLAAATCPVLTVC